MNFFKFPKKEVKTFVTRASFEDNLNNQIKMVPQTLEQLKNYGVSEEKSLSLEIFFYTNSQEKGEKLSAELNRMNYQTTVQKSAYDKNQVCISGWTEKIMMQEDVIKDWTKKMCEIGYSHDCEFDGWGTNPEQ